MIHKCTKCANAFKITEATRSKDRLFKKLGGGGILKRIDQYFLVSCPKCATTEISYEIKMLGLFGPTSAKWGLPASFLLLIVIIETMDYFNL